jgi:hypothetical protein
MTSSLSAEWDEFRLDRMKDVNIDQLTLTDGDIIRYNDVLKAWENTPLAAFPAETDPLSWHVVAAPLTASSAGSLGQMAQDGSYLYVVTAANTWKRVAITTWAYLSQNVIYNGNQVKFGGQNVVY